MTPPPDPPTARPHVLGVDSGGSGLRVAVAFTDGPVTAPVVRAGRNPVRTGPHGIDADHLMAEARELADRIAAETGALRPAAVCVGAAGTATLGGDLRRRLPALLATGFGARRLVLAADAVTAYAGALGQRPGAVVAAGTGLIGLGTGLGDGERWRRADGWGHLLGDCGGGAWIGRAGLEAALRAHDGRSGGSTALLVRLEARFGPAPGLPALLYPRSDRPAVLASFAPDVAACAPDCAVAAGILREAAAALADTAAAVFPAVPGARVACTGGLTRMAALREPLRAALAARLPSAEVVEAAGDPLDGALGLAAALAADRLCLPRQEGLLETFGT